MRGSFFLSSRWPFTRAANVPTPMLTVYLVVLFAAFGTAARAQICVGDCNDNGTVEINELVTAVNIALGYASASTCSAADSNADSEVMINELVAGVNNALLAPGPCGSYVSAASLTILLPTSLPGTVNLSGSLVQNTADSPYSTQYPASGAISVSSSCACSPPATCSITGGHCQVAITDIAPGVWKHSINVPSTNQAETQKSLVLFSSATPPNPIGWVTFASVYTVNQYASDDYSNVTCPRNTGGGTCYLRDAIAQASSASPPVLIQFAPSVQASDGSKTIQITQPYGQRQSDLTIMSNVTIDGTDQNGNPSAIDGFESRLYSVNVQLNLALDPSGVSDEDVEGNGAFGLAGSNSELLGLSIHRIVPTGATGGKAAHAVDFKASGNSIVNCQVDGGAAGETASSTGRDCINSGNPGTTTGIMNTVQSSEIKSCWDKGVKAAYQAGITVTDSYIHDTIDTGMQATLSGALVSRRNLVENCGAGTTAASANGISANGADGTNSPSVAAILQSDSDVVRNTVEDGFIANDNSTVTIKNSFSCGCTDVQANGIALKTPSGATAPSLTIGGTAAVLNKLSGIAVVNATAVTESSGASNAFTRNAANKNATNSMSTLNIALSNTQWQHCYSGAPSGAAANSCSTSSINGNDITGSITVASGQPHQANSATLPLTLASPDGGVTPAVYPPRAIAGGIVHIYGTGFNAIDGITSTSTCNNLLQSNTCSPSGGVSGLQGTCVQFVTPEGTFEPADILAVTPTEIVVKAPTSCAQGEFIQVTRKDASQTGGGAPLTSNQISFCY